MFDGRRIVAELGRMKYCIEGLVDEASFAGKLRTR